jgi:hypothetical protein
VYVRKELWAYLSIYLSIYVFLLMSLTANPALTQTMDVYPKPISESAEISAPGKMTILSYPKYYKNAQDQLTEVDTTLVPSNDPDWDYEVTTGIWTLKVRGDGTFQARHEGDIFTYRFQSLGYGRGSNYRPFDLGQADWSSMVVLGDTIRWVDVYPNVDVSVRYIHDSLKVDVIVKKEKLREIKQAVLNGELDPDDYLTARFDIPNVFIRSQAKKGDKEVDLYADVFEIDNQPVHFEKDGKKVHKLRLVESYIIDDSGKRIKDYQSVIHTAQLWKLQNNKPGIAEMSVYLDDLADAPEGNLVIDPSVTYDTPADVNDTYIDSGYSNINYGSQTTMYLGNSSNEQRILIGFESIIEDKVIEEATLKLYYTSIPSSDGDATAIAYPITNTWSESTATWSNFGTSNYKSDFGSPEVNLPWAPGSWSPSSIHFDVTDALIDHYYDDPDRIGTYGFIVKLSDYPSPEQYWRFETSDSSSIPYRPLCQHTLRHLPL